MTLIPDTTGGQVSQLEFQFSSKELKQLGHAQVKVVDDSDRFNFLHTGSTEQWSICPR